MACLGVVQLVILFQLAWVGSVCGRILEVNHNGNDTNDCLTGEQTPCASLGYVLTNLQSGDYINITSDEILSLPEVANLNGLNDITIEGKGSTIVMCNNVGGISCNSCSNVVIEGITWDGCGNPDHQNLAYPDAFGGLNFTNVANLSIANCTLQNSRVRALSLYLIAGFVDIIDTQFLNNTNNDTVYCFQGPVYIHCVTDDRNVTGAVYIQDTMSEANISISNCNFSNNGHFGEVIDNDPTHMGFEQSEIADGAAIKVLQTNTTMSINIAVENSVFSYNRGRSGGAVNINISLSQNIKFNNVSFLNNSVVRHYVNSSALFVFLRNTPSTVLQLSNCNFQYNCDGRNMIGFIVAGEPSVVLISNSRFLHNIEYNVGLVELNMQSPSVVNLEDSYFANNTGNALLYVQLRSRDINVSLYGLNIFNNTGSTVLRRGGLLSFRLFEDNCTINITKLNYAMNNYSRNSGGLYITGLFRTVFRCYVREARFENNIGRGDGTIIFSLLQSDNAYAFAIYNSTFVNNIGRSIVRIGKISLMEDLVLTNMPSYLYLGKSSNFSHNSGTPIRLSDVILVGIGDTEFSYNMAQSGAALHLTDSYVVPYVPSFQYNFFHNFAIERGGAIYIDLSTNLVVVRCTWHLYQLMNNKSLCNQSSHEIANDCPRVNGELFCSELPQQPGVYNAKMCHFNYANNSATVSGSTIFYNVPTSMPIENSTDPNSIFYIPQDHCMNFSTSLRRLATQPYELRLQEPAVCLDDNCTGYFLNGITLGQEIRIPAQVVGYNNKPAEAVVFFVTCVENCSAVEILGRRPVLINDSLTGIHIIGLNSASKLIKLQLSSDTITLNLTVGLIPCTPGFVYDGNTRQCECFTIDDIVSCSPNTTIERDHWFGVVDGVTTVSVCPNGYCNFSHEVFSGRFLLSPIQDDQCSSHRTGPACGECDAGYTLSYDSVDCVSVDDCHYKYKIAVILWTLVYWLVFSAFLYALSWYIINHLKFNKKDIGIGCLYGIIYYYSVADILLGRILNFSEGLSNLVSILSIFFKLNPGFDLFKFCFVQDMQSIDQYIINYIHATAILLFIVLLILLGRTKCYEHLRQRIGVAGVATICLSLTMAYTSIADTSLQLLRYIQFTDVDETFTYLSPSSEYFTGRHVVYLFIAVLYEVFIVGGLPFLLILGSLNLVLAHWDKKLICNKIDLMPIFDQFQECYKKEYRWFAAVYLICRQIILIIVVINFSDYYTELYLLTIVCLITAILHYSIQPYKSDILNKFDGFLLQMLLLIVSLQMVAFSNGFTTAAVEGVAYLLLLFPLLLMAVVFFLLVKYPWLGADGEHNERHVLPINSTAATDARQRRATITGSQPVANAVDLQLKEPLLANGAPHATTALDAISQDGGDNFSDSTKLQESLLGVTD